MVLKPILKNFVLPKLIEGNPAEIIYKMQPYLEAGAINADTGKVYFDWPPEVKGKLYLEVNPHNMQHPIKIRLVDGGALVYPMDGEEVKAFLIQMLEGTISEPDPAQVVDKINKEIGQ